MLQNYGRAARMSGPKASTSFPDFVGGYWTSSDKYFYVVEIASERDGKLRREPRLADPVGDSIDVIPFEQIVSIVRYGGGPDSISSAWWSVAYEMLTTDMLVASVDGRDYHIRWSDRSLIATSPAFERPALYSPDGRDACILDGDNLALISIESGERRSLTTQGTPFHRYGAEPEACLATGSYRKAPMPVGLWSATSRWFITHRIDEDCVPDVGLIENAPSGGGRPILHQFKYPVPGDPVPLATIVAIDVQEDRVIEFNEFCFPSRAHSPFFFKLLWFGDNCNIWLVRIDRYWKTVELVELDLEAGSGRVILTEAVDQGYIEPNQVLGRAPNVAVLEGRGEVIWYSERDGWGHLYRYDLRTGELKNQITNGDWVVRDLVHIDEQIGQVFFTASGLDREEDPSRRALCSIDLDGSNLRVLLKHDGDVAVARTGPWGLDQYKRHRPKVAQSGLSANLRFAVVELGNVATGNSTEVVDFATGMRQVLVKAQPGESDPRVRHFEAVAADGVTPIFGVMFLPSDFDERKTYPLIDYVYPGPQTFQQPQFYATANSAQARTIAELGFAVIMLDTRGMPSRSRAIHQIGYGHLLEPQLADHASVVEQLRDRFHFVAGDRAGIIGYSGGGAATARALFDYPGVFTVGVSVCGNHDSSSYHHAWSDKYRGPGEPSQWVNQSNAAAASGLEGKLLLISGDMDENVHVAQTITLSSALIEANKNFDLLIVPGAGHFVLFTNGYAQRRSWDFFVEHLALKTPPHEFELCFSTEEVALFRDRLDREYWR